MKTTFTILAIAALSTAALAQMDHEVSKNANHVIACPVTGDKVDMVKATKSHMFADYKGHRYFFCCADCPSTFKKNPAKFAGKPHIKTPRGKPARRTSASMERPTENRRLTA